MIYLGQIFCLLVFWTGVMQTFQPFSLSYAATKLETCFKNNKTTKWNRKKSLKVIKRKSKATKQRPWPNHWIKKAHIERPQVQTAQVVNTILCSTVSMDRLVHTNNYALPRAGNMHYQAGNRWENRKSFPSFTFPYLSFALLWDEGKN